MTIHPLLYLFLSLVLSSSVIQAQPLLALNMVRPSGDPATPTKAPNKALAVESPLYVKVYGFYGLLTPGSQITSSSNSNSYKTNGRGLGAGPRVGVGIGTIVSDFINIGIDADMLFGAALTTDNAYQGSTYTFTSNSTTTLKVLSITPNITFKALSRPTFYIYNRLGLVGGVVLDYKTIENSTYTPSSGNINTNVTETNYAKNSLVLGYQAALGIQFRLSQSLRGFAEVVANNQSFKPKEMQYSSTNTQSGQKGVSTPYKSITEYKAQGEYTTTQRDGVDVVQSPFYNVAMNSVGVGVGLLVRF